MPQRPRKAKRRGVPKGSGSKSRENKREVSRTRGPAGRRLWCFRLAAIIIGPVLFLGLLELGLRAGGYGYNPNIAVQCEVNGVPHLGSNVKFGWRFFSPTLAREFEPFVFPMQKPAGTCRIFVLGASAAQGVPNNAFRFARILEVMLRRRFSGVDFEVITAAMAAINSHVVLEIARDCARYEPDLFVVYLGNNEVVGPYGPGTVLTPALSNLHLIRLGVRFQATKVGQLFSGLAGSRRLKHDGPQYWRGMAMFLGQQVRADDPRLRTTYGHFQRNLEDICRTASEAGAETILCTVGANLRDCPPFASLHRPNLTPEQKRDWQAIYRQGVVQEMQGKYAEAVASYLEAATIDDSHAELQFRLGRCYELLSDHENARAGYTLARDLDTLRFRADTRINDTIRTVAGRMEPHGVRLADIVAAVEANSPNELPGEELFHEHVHLTFEGHYLVARTVLRQVELIVAERFAEKATSRSAVPTLEQCAERVGYNDWSRRETLDEVVHSFLERPPFTNQLYHKDELERRTRELQSLQAALTPEALQAISDTYRAAVQKAPDDWRLRYDYGQLLAEDLKQYDAAAEQYRAVQRLLPHSYLACDALAAVLRVKGDLDGAVGEYQKVLAIKPTSGSAYYYLGWCYEKQGDEDAAIERYRKAIQFKPDLIASYLDLGELLFKRKRYQEAVQICRAGLAVAPNHPMLHSNLGLLLIQMGNRPEGVQEIRKALELDPDSPQIRRVAERLLGPAAVR